MLKVLEHYKPDPAAAQQTREIADRQPPNTTDAIDLARFYSERGRAAQRIGRVSQQIDDLRLAFKYGAGLTPDERRAILGALSSGYTRGGDFASALEMRKVEASLTTGPGSQVGSYAVLSRFYATLGDLAAARTALAQSEAAMQQAMNTKGAGTNRWAWSSRLERARGTVAMADGRTAEAEPAFRKAVEEVQTDMRMRRDVVNEDQTQIGTLIGTLRQHAASLTSLGRLSEAELALRAALRVGLERGGRDSAENGYTVAEFSELLSQQGRMREAVLVGKEALNILERAGALPEADPIVRVHRSLGRVMAQERRWQEANTHFERMYDGLQRNAMLQQTIGLGDLAWSLTLVRLGNAEKALALLGPMLQREETRFGPVSYQAAEARGFLGIAYAAAGQRDAALKAFAAAVPVILERGDEHAGREGGAGRTWRITQVLDAYIALLVEAVERRESAGSIDAVAESFRLADLARGGRVQKALTSSAARASISDPRLADLARKEQDAEQRLAALNELLTDMLSAPPQQQLPKIIEDLRREMGTLRAERAKAKTEIERQFPDYANLVSPKPPTLDGVRATLLEGEALISIYISAARTFVWSVPKSGNVAVAAVAMTEADLTRRIASLRQALDPNATTIDDIPKFDVAGAYALYTALLKPVESGWGQATSLLVVPHLALGQIPFALLPTTGVSAVDKSTPFEGYRDVAWLARRAAITQLPSVNALIALRRTPAAPQSRRAYAGFGDPFFTRAQAKETLAALADETLGTRGIKLRNKPKTAALDSAQLALLPRLPDTRAEILDVAQVLRADVSRDVFLGERANVQAVKAGDLADRKVIHFATHGLVPGELDGLTEPALALTTPELAPGAGNDGLLRLQDILSLKLNADWVVLSACNTASADGSGNAEAVSGLGRAFLYAGTRALLVSNWPVDSASARQLMTDLFRKQGADATLDRAQALRQAMLEMIDSGVQRDVKDQPLYSYAHPLFWAPFTLVGEGAGR